MFQLLFVDLPPRKIAMAEVFVIKDIQSVRGLPIHIYKFLSAILVDKLCPHMWLLLFSSYKPSQANCHGHFR